MASINQQIFVYHNLKDLTCEVRNHGREERLAKYILSFEYLGGKLRNKKIVARRAACSSCAASFARTNDLPIPPHIITFKQKIQELKGKYPYRPPDEVGEFYQLLKGDLYELIELLEVTFGL